ncbi:MAG: ABC transporter ATP-binding protein [Candidatus Eremiobacteraeota bacterium]|nr:ABC transporter ATP-binding protein [Candidatus Eremiobacteraeota bacterium]
MSFIQLSEIKKDYYLDGVVVPALRGIDLEIQQGEFFCMMGASGSGKSTLMNLISCMDRPTSGKYILEGRDVANLDKNSLARLRNKTVGLVFQNFNLLSSATALENVELPLLYGGIYPAERSKIAKQLLEKVGLGDRFHHYPTQLSGGQQQRVAIARALVNNPKILMADEPTGNLDSQTSEDIMAMLTQLNKEGLTIVLVTHEPDVARYAKRVVHLKDGKILKEEKR